MLEDMTPMPEDPYGVSKYAVELDLKCAHEMFGLNYIIFRPHNVYGENQNLGDRYRNVIGIFIKQIMEGKALTIFGDGEQTRVINIGADVPFSINKLAEVVSKTLGVPNNVTHLPARNEVMHAYANHEKAQRLFSIEGMVALEEGVRRMVAWAKTAGVRKGQDFDEIEIYENLPPSWLSEVKPQE
jgi:UDP-glucose 4-epimerase